MKFLRGLIVVLLVAYAAWVAFPGARALMEGAWGTVADRFDQRTASAPAAPVEDPAPAADGAPVVEVAPESLAGEAAAVAVEEADAPVVSLWAAVIALYLLAAFLFANGNLRFLLAYAAAFGGDVILSILNKGAGETGLIDKVLAAVSTFDLRYLATVGLIVLGLAMISSRRPDRRRSRPGFA